MLNHQEVLEWAESTGVRFGTLAGLEPHVEDILFGLQDMGWVIRPDGTFPMELPDGCIQEHSLLHGLEPVFDGKVVLTKSRVFYSPQFPGGVAFIYADPEAQDYQRGELSRVKFNVAPPEVDTQEILKDGKNAC